MEKKYTALRIIGTIYKVAGVLIALGTVLMVFFEIVGGAAGSGLLLDTGFNTPLWTIFAIISTVIGGGLAALSVYAIGELMYLLINLEENTRFSAMVLRDRFFPPQHSQPIVPPRPSYPTPPNPQPTQQPPVV